VTGAPPRDCIGTTEAERAAARERQRRKRARDHQWREDALEVIEWFCRMYPADGLKVMRESRVLANDLPGVHADLQEQQRRETA
jgi:hypothetical protein